MLRRNRFGFRMRRRSLTSRLLQFVVVLSASSLFICLLLYALNFSSEKKGPDYSWLKTRNMSVFLKPNDPSTTMLEPQPQICQNSGKLRLFVMVHSSISNTERRNVIRRTWGKAIKKLPGVRMVFTFGQSKDSEDQQILLKEQQAYNDILQHEFVDSFANLTLKTAFNLKWITGNNCSKAKFVFKCDDDTFVNPNQLWAALDHALLHSTTRRSLQPYNTWNRPTTTSQPIKVDPLWANNPHGLIPVPLNPIPNQDEEENEPEHLSESIDYLIMGYVVHSVPVRDPRKKLYLPSNFYPLNVFPKYVGGAGYVLSPSVMPAMFDCLLRTPYMNLEDVMLMGLCATTQLGLTLTHHPLFRLKKPQVGPDYVCYYKESPIVHPLESHEMDEMWVKTIDTGHNCDTFYFGLVQHMTIFVEFIKNLLRIAT